MEFIKKYEPIISVVIILAIIICLNIIATEYYFRLDLTENKEYTLSPGFNNIIKSVEDRITIKAYFSEDLPFYLASLRNNLKDFLEEVRIQSNGNINYAFYNPDKNEDIKKQAQKAGVPEVQLNYYEKDKAEIKKVHFGLAMYYEDKKEAIPIVRNIGDIEYDFAVALLRLTQDQKPKIGIMTGKSKNDVKYEDLKNLVETLSKTYQIKYQSPDSRIGDYKTLLVIKSKDFNEKTFFNIDQYLMKGRNVIFCASGMEGPPITMYANRTDNKLIDLIDNYGIRINKDLVVDRVCSQASFFSGYFSITLPYPFFVKIIPQDFNKNIAAVSSLESLVLPWTSSIERSDTSSRNSFEPLAWSTPFSEKKSGFVSINYNQKFNLNKESDTSVIAVISRGTFNSFFADKDTEAAIPKKEYDDRKKVSDTSTIVVVSSENFIPDRTLRNYPENQVFINNIIDQLSLGDNLISIRSKKIADRPIEELKEAKKNLLKYVNMYGIPILIVLIGIIRYFIRKKMVRKIYV